MRRERAGRRELGTAPELLTSQVRWLVVLTDVDE
jgi:hypothetical protein